MKWGYPDPRLRVILTQRPVAVCKRTEEGQEGRGGVRSGPETSILEGGRSETAFPAGVSAFTYAVVRLSTYYLLWALDA